MAKCLNGKETEGWNLGVPVLCAYLKDTPWHRTAWEGSVTRMEWRIEVASPGTKIPDFRMVVDRRGMEENRHLFGITYGLLVTVLGTLLTSEKRLGSRRSENDSSAA